METKIVINDPKTGKSYQKVLDGSRLIGKKIGEIVQGKSVGVSDYEFMITGGSDDAGFPMRKDLDGSLKKKVLIGKSVGLREAKDKGYKKRKSVRGNTISEKTAQINIKIVKYGSKSSEEVFSGKEESEKKE